MQSRPGGTAPLLSMWTKKRPLTCSRQFRTSQTCRDHSRAGIAKSTKVVIAGNPDSQSGKEKKARQYGVPITDEDAVNEVISF